MVDIRPPEDSDRDAIAYLASLSFNVPLARARRLAPELRLDRYLCAYEGKRLIATTQAHDLEQWFGGRPLRMAGIASVATIPERRGTGVASLLLEESLRTARDTGFTVSALFPATVPVYRRLGYEFGGVFVSHEVALRSLHSMGSSDVKLEELEGDDFEELTACHRAYAADQNGLSHSEDDKWWSGRILFRTDPEATSRVVIVRGSEGVEGYAAYRIKSRGEYEGSDVECSHLVGLTERANRALIDYFRRFQGVSRALSWEGPPAEPLGLLVPERSIRTTEQFEFMQ